MNGEQKKAAINKIKTVTSAASPSANGKKRRKGQDLKPIITNDGPGAGSTAKAQRYVLFSIDGFFLKFFIPVRLTCPTATPLPHVPLEHTSMIPLVIVVATVKDA